jgi:hypothetical protein
MVSAQLEAVKREWRGGWALRAEYDLLKLTSVF